MPKGTHDIYDDDWLWQRGNVGANHTDLRVSEVLCVPRVVRNVACRYSDDDAGIDCTADLAWAYDAVRVTEKANWLDFSTPTYIECVVESMGESLPRYGMVASVNITLANATTLVDSDSLTASLEEAQANFNCKKSLSHCLRKDTTTGVDLDWFGTGIEYDGATQEAPHAFHFSAEHTPEVEFISPTRAMPGTLIDIHGKNFLSTVPFTDTNWYMTDFGYYEQPTEATVNVGTYPCVLFSHNDTLIQCYAILGSMLEPMAVRVNIHGRGNAECDAVFTYAVDVYTVSPSVGSLAGGTTVTVGTSQISAPTAGFDVSIKSFDVWLVPEGSQTFSEAQARVDVDSLSTDPIASAQTETSVTFVSEMLSEAVGRVPSLENERTLMTWLLTHWDGNEIYSECKSNGNCTFSYAASATPVLAFNTSESHFLKNQPQLNNLMDTSVTSLVVGDTFTLAFDTSSQPNGTAFNWSTVDSGNVVVTINNASLAFDLSVVEQSSAEGGMAHVVHLVVVVGDHVPPCAPSTVDVQVEPWGRAVALNATVEILPVIVGLSHTAGSNEGGLELTVTGRGLDVAGSEEAPVVSIGGTSCVVVHSNSTAITCTTSSFSGDAETASFNVSVTVFGMSSTCLRVGGCGFQFSNRTSHTPKFRAVEPSNGHWPDQVTITGAGFNATGTVVTVGYRTAAVVSATSTQLVVEVPKHVGGTYALSVHVPGKGYASGFKQWFRYDSGIESITPKLGSRYGGQRITISGFGFAPAGTNSTASEEDTTYDALFNAWTNYGTANESAPFEFTALEATFDRIVATTHFESSQQLDGAFEDDWLNSLSVDVAKEADGYVGPDAYYYVSASDGDAGVSNVFDGDPTTVYDGYGGGVDLEILYVGYAAFLLTDYQVLSHFWTVEMPSKWRLFGRETWEADWELVDTMAGPQSEPETYKYMNRTCDNPGYYLCKLCSSLALNRDEGKGIRGGG
jgi:hypothetical protein